MRVAHKSAGTPISRGIRWDRLPGNWLVLIVLVMAVLYVPPLHSYVKQRQDTTAAKAELQNLSKENRSLKARARALKRNSTIELEARKLGMVKEDERPYVILR
jgi:cell division protein FtsB